jgi:hypothetical protein
MERHVAHCHVLEFKKRGLPHAHVLIIVNPDNKLRNGDNIQKAVCAELPTQGSLLFQIGTSCMLHRDCTRHRESSCLTNQGVCSKG